MDFLEKDTSYNKIAMGTASVALFDEGFRCGYISCGRRNIAANRNSVYSLYNLRMLYKMLLASKKDGVLIHSSSLEMDGAGYVFIGPGRAGKSTVARLLEPDNILSDETTLVRKVDNSYNIFSNPWWNAAHNIKIYDPKRPVRLKALFFIKKSEKTKLKRIDYKVALTRLFYTDTLFQQFRDLDNKACMRNFYLFCCEMLKRIPFFEIEVYKDASFKKDFKKKILSYL